MERTSLSRSDAQNTIKKDRLTSKGFFYKFSCDMAKPSKTAKKKRTVLLMFSVTPEEKKIFMGLAEQRRSSFAEMVRQILFREAGTTSKVA
jgi:hypothetical protein